MKNLTLILFYAALMAVNTSNAATIIVDNNQDLGELDGNCDLRDAINSANINISIDGCVAGQAGVQDIIIVQVAGPIQLESTLPVFSSVYITPTFNAEPVEIKAAPGRRHMRVSPNSVNDNNFLMVNFKMSGGEAMGENSGGAILFTRNNADLGVIELNSMIFENNHANDNGGALDFDNTFATSIRIADNIFVNNSATGAAGAISGSRMVRSGENSSLKIIRSHFEGNSTEGSAGVIYMINEDVETAELNDNHFIGNSASERIGAVGLSSVIDHQSYYLNRNLFMFNQAGTDSGALEVSGSTVVQVRDSLFAFNSAQRGGAVTSVYNNALLRMSSSTLVHNSASISGDNVYIYPTGRFLPYRNIIASPVNGDNCYGVLGLSTLQGVGYNITNDNSCELLSNLPSTTVAEPLLSGFSAQASSYPGFTPTANSPALDSGSSCSNADLMGNSRPQDGNGDGEAYCDTGAIEAPESTDLIWSDSFGL